MYVVPTKANPRGYSLTPSTTEPYATCQPKTPEAAACLSISPPRGAPLSYPGGGINGSGWAPPELRDAYKIPATGGAGQTVAIVIAYHYKNAESDLSEYRKKYELPSCTKENGCLEIVNQKGEKENFPAENTGWNTETSLDLDMVSAICPECHIRLVEATSSTATNLSTAVDTAAKMTGGVGPTSVISTSWTVNVSGEFSGEASYDTYYNHPGIPITAASGDEAFRTYYPAVSPYVISVGGTVLKENSETSRGWTESVWLRSGGGCSEYESKPTWQTDWQCSMRTDNDTAAQGELGVSIYSGGVWKGAGGTSASSPIVAAVLAHASKAVREQQAEAFYRHSLFDTTMGRNGSTCANTYLCTAEEGYDGPTGWGSPNGPLEVSAGFGVATEEATNTTQTGTTLHGYVDPEGAETTYWFEYGQTTAYGRKAPASPASAGSGTRWKAVSQSPSGLEEDRTYHYRLVANNGTKTVYGSDHRVATAPWAIKETPKPVEETNGSYLTDVSCTASTACTGVGWYENGKFAQLTLAERWDGSKWTVQTTPNPSSGSQKKLDGVSCSSVTTCIAVGHYVDGVEKAFAELMYAGEWYIQTTPVPEGTIGSSLSSVSCLSLVNCTAVGRYALSPGVYSPLVERWNGSSWSPESIAQPEGAKYTELKGLSCTSTGECVAVGKLTNSSGKAVALRWDGTTWASQELPSTTTLSSVSCSASEACTAVGATGSTLTAERWDGKEWSLQSMPDPVASYETPGHGEFFELNSVSCPSASRCVAVGKFERESEKTTLAEVWNGTEWFVQGAPRPRSAYLYGVACSSDTFCVGVGSQYGYSSPFAHFLTLAETASLPASAKPVVETTAATKVTGGTANLTGTVNPEGVATSYYFEYGLESEKYEYKTSGGNAGFYKEAAAESEAISGLKGDTTYHYRIVASNTKGTSQGKDQTFKTPIWSLRSFPAPSGAKWTVPRRVSCVSTTECIAVGDYENSSGTKATLAERWNGSEWTIQSTPSPSGAKWSALADVSCVSSTACTAVGRYENGSSVEVTLAERWDGTEWTVQSTPNPSGAKSSWLEDVACTSSTACTAVGRYLNSSSVEVTLAERWNGTEWSIQSTPNPSGAKWSRLADVACATATSCTAVGSYENSSSVRVTLAETWNGSSWSISTTLNPGGSEWNSLKGVWCGSASECAAVGSYRVGGEYRALVERLNGAEWSIQTTPEPKRGSLLDIACLSTAWCEATGTTEGKEPLAEHWDGSEWTIESTSIPPSGSVSVLEGLSCPSTCVSVGYSEEAGTPSPLAESYPLRPPSAKTEAATAIGATQATLKGMVNPNGAEAKYFFEYGLTTSYGSKTAEVSAGSGTSYVEASQTVSGLHAESVYHYRLVAKNSEGTSYGKDGSLMTLGATPSYLSFFGGTGSGNGQFEYPRGIAVDSGGNVWVSDASMNRIQKFNEKGEYLSKFGTTGSGNGQFSEPVGIAATSGGNLWIVDSKNNRVQEVDPEGKYIAQFGSLGSGNGQFNRPWGIAIAPDGAIWVADKNNNRIEKFTASGEFVLKVGTTGSESGQFSGPQGLGTDSSGNVWVADTGNNRVQEFSAAGAFLTKFGTTGSEDGQLTEPHDVTVKPTGNLFVVDGFANHRAQEFTPSGGYLAKTAVGKMWGPEQLAMGAGGKFFVVDAANRGVYRWSQPAKPEMVTQAPTNVKANEATLNGLVNPSGAATTYHFEYGTTTAYGTSVPVPGESVGSGTEALAKSKAISGLSGKTTYHFRIVAENSEGESFGKDLTFTTS